MIKDQITWEGVKNYILNFAISKTLLTFASELRGN